MRAAVGSRDQPRSSGTLAAALLLIALVIGAVVSMRGMTTETAVSLQGDMARYLMDGVFLRDFLTTSHAWSIDGALNFAKRYYVQYPALSLGHHPPLLPAVLVPFFLVFGISVEAARIAMTSFFLLAILLMYSFVRRVYDRTTAGWACVLLASMPFLAEFGQSVLSEMPAIACVLATLTALMRFRQTGRVRDYVLLVVLAITSLSARQLAIFMFPAYALLLLHDGGWRQFRQPTILIPTAVAAGLILLLAVATLVLSPFNVHLIRDVLTRGSYGTGAISVLRIIATEQLNPALLLLAAGGIAWGIAARDRRVVIPIAWILSVLAGVVFVTGPLEPARYSVLAVPAYCLAGASLWARTRDTPKWLIVSAALVATVAWQSVSALAVRPVGAHGYEEAAAYVVQHSQSSTVLYTGVVDTGYFVFFVRKHDPARRLIVLRSDKMLTTSRMRELSVQDRISAPRQIYDTLRDFGTRFIVIEDVASGSKVIDWLRDELRGPHFAERGRFPIETRDHRLRAVDLVVYEYLEATPPRPDAQIDVKLPVVGREIRVPLSDFGPTTP